MIKEMRKSGKTEGSEGSSSSNPLCHGHHSLFKNLDLNGNPYAVRLEPNEGNVIRVTHLQYHRASLLPLEAPERAVAFPSPLNHQDVQEKLLRDIAMGCPECDSKNRSSLGGN